MIVSEKNVSDALTFFALGGEANEEAAHLAAEQRRERLYAELYLLATGTVSEREATVHVSPEYQQALAEENEAKAELTRAKSRAKGADKLIDVWRTEKANHREAEKMR